MRELLLFLGVAAAGNVVYHVAQKAMPPGQNPMVVLMAVYAVSFVLAGAAAPFFRGSAPLSALLSWPVLVLGAGVLCIELGFFLAYRTGGAILPWSGVAVNGASALVLLPVGLLVFREQVTASRGVGILLTLVGMTLMAR